MPRPKGVTYEKVCKGCSKTFSVRPSENDHLYCSWDCYKTHCLRENAGGWKGGQVERTCEYCNKTFFVHPTRIRRGDGRFCSMACRARQFLGSGAKHPNWTGGDLSYTCENCSKVFTAKRAYRDSRRYCSAKCGDLARQRRVEVICAHCGKSFQERIPVIERGRKFCGTRCAKLHRPTGIEIAIRNELARLRIQFIPEYRVGRYSIDVFIPSANLAIECDGAYWHRDKSEHDKKRDEYLYSKGIATLRLAEHDIRENLDACVAQILKQINP